MLKLIAAVAPKVATYLPAVGLGGLALYHAINQQDFAAAYQDLVNAAAIVGIGSLALAKPAASK